MTITVTVPSTLSYDGLIHTYTDDSNSETGLDGGGHVLRFLPVVKDVLSMAQFVANADVNADITMAQLAATSADSSATDALNYSLQAQNYSLGTTATSTTSLTVGTGSFTLTVGTNKNFQIGQYITVTKTTDHTVYFVGKVTAYSGSSLTFTTVTTGGSGANASWKVALSGVPGSVISGLAATVDNNFTVDQTINDVTVGHGKGASINNTALGYFAMQPTGTPTGDGNTAIGSTTLSSITSGNDNCIVGRDAGQAITSGSYNVAIGANALFSATVTTNNVAIGDMAMQDYIGNTSPNTGKNVAIGANSMTLTGGSYNCTFVGADSGTGANNWVNCGGFGYGATPLNSNQIRLGNSLATVYTQSGTVSASDVRDKADIRDTTLGLAFIESLRPVDYKWDIRLDYAPEKPEQGDMDKEQYKAALVAWSESCKPANLTHDGTHKRNRYHHGLIAQELGALLAQNGIDFGGYQNFEVSGGEAMQAVVYEELIAPMIKAIQELSARVTALENK